VHAAGLTSTVTQNAQGDTVVTSEFSMGGGNAGAPYWQLFAISGTSPGVVGPSPWPLIPLNLDGMTELAESVAGSPIAPDSYGVLDGTGRASTVFTVPAFVAQLLPGLPFQSCVLVLNATSNQVVGASRPTSWSLP